MIKILLKFFLPKRIFDLLKRKGNNYKRKKELKKAYRYDWKQYRKYSNSFFSDSATKLIGEIIKAYHVIEKGLTMPEVRFGFGQQKIIELTEYCNRYIREYGTEEEQLQHAVQVIFEYKLFHNNHNFKLEEETDRVIEQLKIDSINSNKSTQIEMTKSDYFKYSVSSFPKFAISRTSVRNYTNENISLEKILKSLDLAKKTPSACNRQSWRTYVYTDRDQIDNILKVQAGNRGFGHLTNKLIVICAELGLFSRAYERNQAFIDGGMYAMNVLYTLHYEEIATCILNCSTTPDRDISLRKLTNIKQSEVFIAMIACGIPPENFKIAYSKRYKLEKTNRVVK